jgi:hypothetical protein
MRRGVLAGKLRVLESGQCPNSKGKLRALTAAERAALLDDCAHIQAIQRNNGEV